MTTITRRLAPYALVAAFAVASGGCMYTALVKPKAEKIVTVQGSKAEILAQLSETFKELELKSINVNAKAGYVGAARGLGYAESTFIEARVIGDAAPLQVRVQVKSSGDGQALLDQIIAAFSKRAKVS
ncbi:MAG: hypothetical protein HY923_05735 [Elusimicrobia bacterium]|nr:hypothetical protein [Elusimicrobiota bacterium]